MPRYRVLNHFGDFVPMREVKYRPVKCCAGMEMNQVEGERTGNGLIYSPGMKWVIAGCCGGNCELMEILYCPFCGKLLEGEF